jgi:hypothetical protein
MPRFRILLFVLAFCAGATLSAQVPRMSLVEEGTNASCGPCASQNPTFEHYLSQPYNVARCIPIVYHASWPGRDVMYSANPTPNTARIVTYYAINGVPTAAVNGVIYQKVNASYNGAPSDTVALSNALAAAPATSPIGITITEQAAGASVSVDVAVTSAQAISGKKLRIAVTEGHHYYASAGSNGEKDFYYIMRQMLPDAMGTDLTLGAGETRHFPGSYTLDTAWNADKIYIVAWVQDDATKDVLQAATDRVQLLLTPAGPTAKVGPSGSPSEFAGTIASPAGGEYTLSVTENFPQGWASTVKINDQPVANGGKLTLAQGVQTPISVQITPATSLNRRGEVTVAITGPFGAAAEQSFRFYAQDITALTFVHDEGVETIAQYYDQAFQQGVVTYALVDPADEALFSLGNVPVVVWEVGKNVLYAEDVALLKSYIDGGSRLYLIGAEIAWGLADPAAGTSGFYMDTLFLHNYLHAGYASDDNPNGTLNGIAGDPISGGLTFSITTGVQNQDTPDQLTAINGAVPILYYGGNQTQLAGIRYEDWRNKLVYLGFGLEGIGNLTSRAELLKRGIAWLLAPTGIEQLPGSAASFEAFPMPADRALSVPVSLDRPSLLRVSLHDVLGRTVALREIADAAPGRHDIQFATSSLPSGAYLLRVEVDGSAGTRLLQIAH